MIDYHTLLDALRDGPLQAWVEKLPEQIAAGLSCQRYGDLANWLSALAALPGVPPSRREFQHGVSIGRRSDLSDAQFAACEQALRALIPWRKGPFTLFDIAIDSEWRSDWKWDRLAPHIELTGKTVLDVGCGNGYHCWRMFGAGAQRVIGIDPSPRFVVQFYMVKQLANAGVPPLPVDVLPVGIEALPAGLAAFDTVFSMGVLYHRRSPMDHLRELLDALKPGGELLLETLVIAGELGQCLVPEGRYAKMNNVWFIPSVASLLSWLRKTGFVDARCVDLSSTSTDEQRSTEWMHFQSLPDFLDPNNPKITAEGHPAPLRAMIVASKRG